MLSFYYSIYSFMLYSSLILSPVTPHGGVGLWPIPGVGFPVASRHGRPFLVFPHRVHLAGPVCPGLCQIADCRDLHFDEAPPPRKGGKGRGGEPCAGAVR